MSYKKIDMDTLTADVLIIGAGAAGLRAAIAACTEGVDVVMVAADDVTYGGATFSSISEGWGIQALLGTERTDENLEDFFNDIIRVGLGQCDPKLVRILAEESGPRTEELMSYGLRFKKTPGDGYVRAKGCFSQVERAFLTEDMKNIRQTFLSVLRRLPVRIVTGYATDLIVNAGVCVGAWIVPKSGDLMKIQAKSTILATGGAVGIFRDHMGNGGGMGDGYAMAHFAGAEHKNMEFIQFAMGLKKNGTRRFLPIGELEKPDRLRSSHGADILARYIPDVQSRTEVINMRKGHMPFSCRDSSALVDIAVGDAMKAGEKVYWQNGHSKNDPFEVVHFAHAFNGGVRINENAESTVPGLYAAGEIAAGSYGADRIGGCMMTATQVFGKRAGQFAAERAKRLNGSALPENASEPRSVYRVNRIGSPKDRELLVIQRDVREEIQKHATILRSEKCLLNCLNHLERAGQRVEDMKFENDLSIVNRVRTRNLIATGVLVAQSALARRESRGAHFREDFPNL